VGLNSLSCCRRGSKILKLSIAACPIKSSTSFMLVII
jgi:hypothetical protein